MIDTITNLFHSVTMSQLPHKKNNPLDNLDKPLTGSSSQRCTNLEYSDTHCNDNTTSFFFIAESCWWESWCHAPESHLLKCLLAAGHRRSILIGVFRAVHTITLILNDFIPIRCDFSWFVTVRTAKGAIRFQFGLAESWILAVWAQSLKSTAYGPHTGHAHTASPVILVMATSNDERYINHWHKQDTDALMMRCASFNKSEVCAFEARWFPPYQCFSITRPYGWLQAIIVPSHPPNGSDRPEVATPFFRPALAWRPPFPASLSQTDNRPWDGASAGKRSGWESSSNYCSGCKTAAPPSP